MEFKSERTFQFWDYTASHARMLIRSPAEQANSTNIDVLFFAVEHLNIPTIFRGLNLAAISRDEVDRADVPPDKYGPSTIFRLESEGRRHYLVAIGCYVFENELELFDSSFVHPCDDRPLKDLGRLIVRS